METFSTSEVAKVFGMTESNILNLLKTKKLKFETKEVTSGRYYFSPKEIRRYYKSNISKEAQILSVANIKGGTGKTFFSYVFSLGLMHLGFKILLIDIDEQANISEQVLQRIPNPEEPTILEIFNGDVIITKESGNGRTVIDKEKTANNVIGLIRKTDLGIDIIPSNLRFMTELRRNDIDTYMNLSKCLNLIRDVYDFIIIDTPPTISLHNEAAIIAADYIIPVINPERWAILGIEWLKKKSDSIFEDTGRSRNKMLGCVYNQIDGRKALTKEYLEQTQGSVGGIKIFETKIPEAVAYHHSIEYREDPYRWENKKKTKYKKILMKILTEILSELSKNRKTK